MTNLNAFRQFSATKIVTAVTFLGLLSACSHHHVQPDPMAPIEEDQMLSEPISTSENVTESMIPDSADAKPVAAPIKKAHKTAHHKKKHLKKNSKLAHHKTKKKKLNKIAKQTPKQPSKAQEMAAMAQIDSLPMPPPPPPTLDIGNPVVIDAATEASAIPNWGYALIGLALISALGAGAHLYRKRSSRGLKFN